MLKIQNIKGEAVVNLLRTFDNAASEQIRLAAGRRIYLQKNQDKFFIKSTG
jgi:hypothetical protein